MHIDFLLERFREHGDDPALTWRDETYSYDSLWRGVERWTEILDSEAVEEGAVVSLEADFSPNAVALLLALVERSCSVVPLTSSVEAKKPEFRETAEVEVRVVVDENVEPRDAVADGRVRHGTHPDAAPRSRERGGTRRGGPPITSAPGARRRARRSSCVGCCG